ASPPGEVTMARRTSNRRRFLRGALAGAAALPFLGGLAGRGGVLGRSRTQADGRGHAKRLLVFFTPNGTVHRHWRPTGGRADFAFREGDILSPLTPWRSQLNVIDGLVFEGASNHEGGMRAMLTGGGDTSIDQHVAASLGASAPFGSLELGVQTSAWGGNVQTRMCYRGGAYVPPNDRPNDVYRRVFGSLASEPAEVDAVMARRASVLDLLQDELADLRGRAGALERPKLDAHLEALRSAETSLMVPGATGACDAPAAVMEMDPMANDHFPAVGRAQMDLAVAALACGMTPVASLQWSHTVGPFVPSWLGISEGHHSLSHIDDGNPAGIADFVAIERWFAEQFAYLLERLDATPDPEGDGTMLDHTLVIWAQELGDGRLHECVDVPFVLAGAADGFLRTGQYLQTGGTSHTKLLVSIAQAMGLDDRVFGDPAHGTGPLEGLAA
ncbi:MAG TPA: DUF1552 domain-containing protein, partial [Polyangiaceae bacterium LLY-WYZ-15_(1-7)]|nr:DUF1552 domain-containing protein [Polyangiaceae bacterium LLY-WYZ-15_(1-7)]